MFGYPVEPDFDLAREKRMDRVGSGILIGAGLAIVYDLFGGKFGVEVFQTVLATVTFYGINFYAERKNYTGNRRFWKALLAMTPLHAAFLVGLVWSDRAFPEVMTKAIVFIPVILTGLGVEVLVVDWAAERFKLSGHAADSCASRRAKPSGGTQRAGTRRNS